MAYRFDPYDNSLVVDGFEKGIADSPFDGISDMRNVNIVSVPGEASVNFSTTSITNTNGTGSVVSADAGADTVNITGLGFNLSNAQAVTFSGGSLPAGIVAGTTYWAVLVSGSDYNLYTDFFGLSLLNITGTGTGSVATINMGQPKYFSHMVTPYIDIYFMVDSNGRVWGYQSSFLGNWRFTNNSITGTNGTTRGNGLTSYTPSDSFTTAIGYLFVFRDFQIDYATITSNTSLTWSNGWNPATGTTGNNNYLKNASTGTNNSLVHESTVGPDNKVYYCDANYVGRFYQTAPGTGFDPANTATYTADNTAVLPFTDRAQSLAFLGNNLLVGGLFNVIYPWDTFNQLPQYPLFIAENNIAKMVTVNTNTYIFAGNRGRIYITNGSQASLFKKIPDHISETVEPYFTWGGVTSAKNQLYFGASAVTNAGTSISQYGGLWAIDLDTDAIRLANKLSYATYAGYATAIIHNFATTPAGTGLYVGWNAGSGASPQYGVDTTSSNPYTGSQATIDSDLIPIGTFDKPRDFTRVEYRLTKPMVSGESVTIKYRLDFSQSYTTVLTDSTVGNFSLSGAVNFKNAQWLQLQVVLNSTASSPSYTRLKEIRIKGLAPIQ